MTANSIPRPDASEYIPYYGKYVALVPDGDLLVILRDQARDTARLLRGGADHADFAYEPGKWTVKEVVGHLIDGERIFTHRALRFARGDATPLPGFDENAYVPAGKFGRRSLADLTEELGAVRAATIEFARHLDAEDTARRGSANGHEITVRALLYITAGHELHHAALLRERYGL
ncbi:MAG TPA: DinB family protein [Gemmatimonadaceae bacterium]|nr:DinB family protein [Gemmatimonadaceae bacterium]